MNNPLTNQELLNELEKRVKDGSINIEVNSQVKEANDNSLISELFSNKTILFGVLIFGILLFSSNSRKVTIVETAISLQTKNN